MAAVGHRIMGLGSQILKGIINSTGPVGWKSIPNLSFQPQAVSFSTSRNCASLHISHPHGISAIGSSSGTIPLLRSGSLLQSCLPFINSIRTKVRFSRRKGKPANIRAVTHRFFRLDWGAWIRPRAGRYKKVYKQSPDQKRELRQHVFCNRTQCKLLDKMTTKFWKRKRFYVDDPYEPYQKRVNLSTYFPEKPRFVP
ncbi:hypothetical protein CHS0354_041201 [Potamilus streckersoni]|uniref:Large ribosomal subunit protein bL35m n=1 Tax=Potamilus streckersoni TaxID=2493646 RepID=A0AAE0VU62_9BIVA|nr:hypothetical protein CHS0354_041201 [Potamilus streckersoni]